MVKDESYFSLVSDSYFWLVYPTLLTHRKPEVRGSPDALHQKPPSQSSVQDGEMCTGHQGSKDTQQRWLDFCLFARSFLLMIMEAISQLS